MIVTASASVSLAGRRSRRLASSMSSAIPRCCATVRSASSRPAITCWPIAPEIDPYGDVVRGLEILDEAQRLVRRAEREQPAHGVQVVGVLVGLLAQAAHEPRERVDLARLALDRLRGADRAGRVLAEEAQQLELRSGHGPGCGR